MKKIIILLTAFFLASGVEAKRRTTDELKKIAVSYYNNHGNSNSRRVQSPVSDMKITVHKEQVAVVSNDSFFVVLAIDDEFDPLLGYSEKAFKEKTVSPGFRWWMNAINEVLDKGNKKEIAKRVNIPECFPDSIKPLIKTTWNQEAPYNNRCPLGKNDEKNNSRIRFLSPSTPIDPNNPIDSADFSKCYTGCVATAMAQIMNYHKYPEQGRGMHGYNNKHLIKIGDYIGYYIYKDFENISFDWWNMKDNYPFEWIWNEEKKEYDQKPLYSEMEGDAVAELMFACGVSVNMDYTPKESSAALTDAALALEDYFDYCWTFEPRSSMTTEQWMNRIFFNIERGLPILYRGGGGGDAHAFIIDGYDKNGNVHVNWGWGGRFDGYFNIKALIPNENHNFSNNQMMICEIRPKTYKFDIRKINLTQAGTLSSMLSESEYGYLEGLKVSGDINGSDIIVLRDLCGGRGVGRWSSYSNHFLYCLDLSDANIVEGGECYDDFYDGYTINDVFPKGSFAGCKGLYEIILPRSIKSIDDDAFNVCENLRSIIIPNNVTTIGIRAFSNCSKIHSVTIPPSVKKFDTFAFSGCSRVDSVFIEDLESWYDVDQGWSGDNGPLCNGARLFVSGKELKDVVIPATIQTLRPGTFYGCESIESITFHSGIKEISPYLFKGCTALTEIKVPGYINSIGYESFADCSGLKDIVLEDGIVELGGHVFSNDSNLVSISIPKTVNSIGSYAFYHCNSLKTVNIEDLESWCKVNFGVYSGETYANPLHLGSSLYVSGKLQTDIIIPTSIEQINYLAFYGCGSIESVSFHDKVKEIGRQSFSSCPNLKEVHFFEGLKKINASAFSNDSAIASVIFPQSLLEIGPKAFYGCTSLENVNIPKEVKILGSEYDYTCGYNVFAGCNRLKSIIVEEGNSVFDSRSNCNAIIETKNNKIITGCVGTTIPNDITEIGNYAFLDISDLHYLSIPSNIKRLGNSSFRNCDLKAVWSYIENPYQIYDVFGYSDTNGNHRNTTATLYVPTGTKAKYEQLRDWCYFPIIEEFDPAGIDAVINKNDDIIAIYDISGQRIQKKKQGINIIKYKKGVTKKVVLK